MVQSGVKKKMAVYSLDRKVPKFLRCTVLIYILLHCSTENYSIGMSLFAQISRPEQTNLMLRVQIKGNDLQTRVNNRAHIKKFLKKPEPSQAVWFHVIISLVHFCLFDCGKRKKNVWSVAAAAK